MSGVNESRYGYALFEGLVTFKDDGVTPIPGIAESWTVNGDKTVYTFKLRKSTWSDGTPLTAHDFRWSWLRANDPETGSDYASMIWYIKNAQAVHFWKSIPPMVDQLIAGGLDDETHSKIVDFLINGARQDQIPLLEQARTRVRAEADRKVIGEAIRNARDRGPLSDDDIGIRALDDATLEVTLKSPVAFILDIFGFHTLMPVNRKCLETFKDSWLKPEHFVGNGPFVVEEWRPQYRVVLRKNPRYWDADRVRAGRVVLLTIDSANTAMAYYDTGGVDFLDRIQIPPDFLEQLSARPDYYRYAAFGDYFERFNVTKPPFDDPRVRKAFTHAIDRREVCEKILKGGEYPTDLLVPPFPGYEPDAKGCPYDEKLARKLLDEAYPDRSKFPRVTYLTTNRKKSKDLYAYLEDQWKRVLGVTIEPKIQEWSVYLTSLSNLDFNIGFGGWQGDYSDPHTFIDMFITGGGNNRTGWGSAPYDRWVEDALREPDAQKRFAIYRRCEKTVVEDECIIAPIYVTAERVMYKPFVRGVRPNIMDRFLLKYFYREP